jgi:poly [ADP-ribose] polymerase
MMNFNLGVECESTFVCTFSGKMSTIPGVTYDTLNSWLQDLLDQDEAQQISVITEIKAERKSYCFQKQDTVNVPVNPVDDSSVNVMAKVSYSVRKELTGITDKSTLSQYSKALADMLKPYFLNKKYGTYTVRDDYGREIHAIQIIPKAGTAFIMESMPLDYPFMKDKEKLPEKYFVYVNPTHNNNKFYRMVDLGDGTWGAYYGRIGMKQGESVYSNHVDKPYVYPMHMYYIKLMEKIAKGYHDETELHRSISDMKISVNTHNFAAIKDTAVADLIKRLTEYANAKIKESYTVEAVDVTEAMVEAAKKQLDILNGDNTLRKFNKDLLELMHIIPRRIDGTGMFGVASLLAKDTNDFPAIIAREDSLLSILEGQVKVQSKKQKLSDDNMGLLEAMGLEIYPATAAQTEEVKRHLGDSLLPTFKCAYRVINHKTQKRFNAWLETHKDAAGHKPRVKQFWHGSRNENWWSIMTNGLALNPNRYKSNVVITGKMFGNGIYFAPSSAKSFNYTSYRGTSWANGHSDTAFMALFATAYGEPYEVFSWSGAWSGYDYARLQNDKAGAGCVHAKASQGMLRNDEVIFYNEDQVTINYLVEFGK